MPCGACSKRASRLLGWLGFKNRFLGRARVAAYLFENPMIAVAIPNASVRLHHSRAALLSIALRLLYGRSRCGAKLTVAQVRFAGEMTPRDVRQHYGAAMGYPAFVKTKWSDRHGRPTTLLTMGEWVPILEHVHVDALPPPPVIRDDVTAEEIPVV